jgi:hypothetical protein
MNKATMAKPAYFIASLHKDGLLFAIFNATELALRRVSAIDRNGRKFIAHAMQIRQVRD